MFELTSFDTLGLSQYLLSVLGANNFETATPIQGKAIPIVLEGRDIIGLAQTGTGKTLAFGLPIVQLLIKEGAKPDPKSVRALILAPTRELVNQIAESLKVFTRKSPLKITTVVGGASINKQAQILEKGIDILVATPGRLLDLCNRRSLTLTATRYLVLDEADQMLDLGFIHDLRKIVTMVPKRRQTLLFSATMPQAIAELAEGYLNDPAEVSVTPPGKAADKIEQRVHFVEGRDHKTVILKEQLRTNKDGLSLVFSKTKHGAEKLMRHLDHSGFKVASIHGNKSQGQRDRALKSFRDGEIDILVATDVAARGIDVPGVSHVYNYDLPQVPEAYVHRIGRTARAGRDGVAIAFCGPEDIKLLYDIEKLMGITIPVASGERPEWQGKKKKSGGGEGHRGQRETSRGPREAREKQEQFARKRATEMSSFAEVEELNDGDFRPVRTENRGEGRGDRRDGRPNHRSGEQRRERPRHGDRPQREDRAGQGERPAHGERHGHGDRPARSENPHRGERPAHGERRDNRNHGEGAGKAHGHGQNRHSPARHAGFADDRNLIAGETSGEARPARKPHGQPGGKPQGEGGRKQWHGGNRGGNGGQRRKANGGNRQS